MAKKTEVEVLPPEPLVNADVNIDIKDVIDIAVSEAEFKYKNEQQRLQNLAESLEKQRDIKREEYNKSFYKDGEDHAKKCISVLKKTLSDLGMKSPLSCGTVNDASGKIPNSIEVMITSKSNKFQCVLATTASDKTKTLREECNKLTLEIENNRKEIVRVRKQAANIPMLERQYRAKVAKAKLEESKDGRALLATVMKELDTDIKKLPG